MRFRLPSLFRRRQFEKDMDEELRAHLQHRVEDLVRAGVPLRSAQRQARIEFGALDSAKEECREAFGFRPIDELIADTRHTLRILRKSPIFALVAIGVLSIGFAACTAMFSVVNAILLRPLPYPNSDRIVRISTNNIPLHITNGPVSYPDFVDWSASGILEAVGIYSYENVVIALNGQSERVLAGVASSGVFSTFDVTPVRGRLFTAADDQVTGSPAVILTADFWRRRFGGDESMVGSQVRIDGKSLTVVGIVPSFLDFEGQFDLWLSPIDLHDAKQRDNRFWLAAGRTRPGMGRQQAQARLRQLCRALAEAYPASNKDWSVDVADLKESLVGDSQTQLLVLSGSVFCLLLIVCANVAALYVVRGTVRERELSIRASLGASRARILRQLVTESAVMAVLAAGLGTALAAGAVSLIREHGPRDLPRLQEIHVDNRALLFATGLAILVGLLSGLAPAAHCVRRILRAGMRVAGRGTTDGRRSTRARAVLVSAEVALSVMLLSGSALLVKSFWALAHEDMGFRADHLLTMFVSLPETKFLVSGKYQSEKVEQYIGRLVTALRSLPGVSHVGVGMYAPVGGGGLQTWQQFQVSGENGRAGGVVNAINQVVTPEYFATLGIPLLRGRLFTSADNAGAPGVVLIDEAFQLAHFGPSNPVGRSLILEDDSKPHEIVGVVGNIKTGMPSEPAPAQVFVPEAQRPVPMLTVFIRARQDPALLVKAVQRRVLDVDPDVPAYRVRSAEELVSRSLATKRFVMQVMAGFAGLSVALALIGLYGVLAYNVAQRTREFGLRVALGARPAQVVALVVQQGLTLVLAGVAGGLLGAIALTKVMSSLLYRVSPRDPAVLSMVAVAVFVPAILSCCIPARRAAMVDPSVALRGE